MPRNRAETREVVKVIQGKATMAPNQAIISINPSIVGYHDKRHVWVPSCETDPVCNPLSSKPRPKAGTKRGAGK